MVGGCTPILQLRGYEGPFFAGLKVPYTPGVVLIIRLEKACRQDPEPLFGKSGSGLPKTKVKTKCVRIGSCRLYAPMVPLAPHPCVRWWNTKEMPLKLTRLCLHSLKGGFPHQKTIPPRKGGVRLDGSCVATLRVRGRGGPFFAGPKNGPSHSRRKPSGQDKVR